MLNGKTPRKDIEVQWYADRKMTVTDEIQGVTILQYDYYDGAGICLVSGRAQVFSKRFRVYKWCLNNKGELRTLIGDYGYEAF